MWDLQKPANFDLFQKRMKKALKNQTEIDPWETEPDTFFLKRLMRESVNEGTFLILSDFDWNRLKEIADYD